MARVAWAGNVVDGNGADHRPAAIAVAKGLVHLGEALVHPQW